MPTRLLEVSEVLDYVDKISLTAFVASNIDLSSNYQSLQQSNCTSCEIGADKSAYWTPILYYKHSNGSFEEVKNQGMTVYYLGRGDNATNIQPFPPGFRMLSGVATARSYDTQTLIPGSNRPKADRVSFACLDVAPSKEQPGMTRTSCVNGLRAQIHFQSCWDGVNLYKEDNSHVEYMSGLDNGVCPDTHKVPLIHLFYEVLYSVNEIDQNGGQFVFSQGDNTGYGFHGDFMNGWDQATLKSAIDQGCATTPGGVVGDCAAFKASDNPKTFSQSCPEQPAIITEPVHGMISKLPGCITITSGPAAAKPADMSCSPGADQAAADQASMNGTAAMGSSSVSDAANNAASGGASIGTSDIENGSGSPASTAAPYSGSDAPDNAAPADLLNDSGDELASAAAPTSTVSYLARNHTTPINSGSAVHSMLSAATPTSTRSAMATKSYDSSQ